MNKKELEEVLKIMNEPITVNSIDYKYFTQEQYNRLISVYDNAKWLVDYALTQSRYISDLSERIDKAIEYILNRELVNAPGEYVVNGNVLLEILRGKDE